MPVNHRELMSILATLADEHGIKVTVIDSFKAAAMVGAVTFFSGILLGPIGLAFGGITGGLTAATINQGRFRPVARVILEDMSPHQRALLAAKVQNVISNVEVTDFALLLPLLRSDAALTQLVIKEVVSFIQNEMQLAIA